MKKSIMCLIMILCMLTGMIAVGEENLRIGVMSGPTGMGMAQLMSAEPSAYSFEIYSAPTDATADLASGMLDMLCLPTNTAATLASRKADFIKVAAVNCLGSLYLLCDSTVEVREAADLQGQKIVAGVPNSTTLPILTYIMEQNGIAVELEWEADHDAVVARMMTGDAHIVVLPEPKATAAMTQAQDFKVALNISDEWDAVCETRLPMGCIVVRCDTLEKQPELVNAFLDAYNTSVAFIADPANNDESAEMIAAAGILPKAGIAKKALMNLYGALVCEEGEQMKADLQAFYTVIGQEHPTDSFYYER